MKMVFSTFLCIFVILTAFTITENIQISYGAEFDVSPGDDIQAAINNAAAGDTINFETGTYTLSSTLNLNKSIILAGVDGTILDVSGVSGYGVSWTGDDITMKNIEVQSGGSPVTYTLKISGADNVTLENVTVKDSQKTAVDLNGVNGGTLTDVTATDTISGFGINMVDSNDLTLTDITTSGNAWGGVSIQSEGFHHEGGSDNISFEGDFDVSGDLLLEQDPCRSDAGLCTDGEYVDITNIKTPAKYEFVVFTFRDGDDYKQSFYVESLSDAKSLATSLEEDATLTHKDILIHDVPGPGTVQSSVESKDIENLYLMPILEIGDALAASTSGDTITFESGTYEDLGQITIDKPLTITSDTGDYRTANSLITGDSYIKITGDTDDVTIQGLKFKDITSTPVAVIHSLPGAGQSHENILIEKNSFENTHKHAIKTNISNDNFVINDNRVVNAGNGAGTWTAIIIFAMDNGKVTDNIIDTATFGGINLGGNDSPIKNTIVSGNTISDTFENGIQLANSLNSNVTITENTITNANTNDADNAGAISIWTDSSNATVTKNTMKNNHNGFVICGGPNCGFPPDPLNDSNSPLEDDIIFKENTIFKNNDGKGIVNLAPLVDGESPTFDAPNNYWGSKKGPTHDSNPDGKGADVDDNVTFSPFFIDSGLELLNTDPLPVDTIVVFVEDDLQTALDGANSGDVIQLAAGTHDVGSVVITKPITIISDTGNYQTTKTILSGTSNIKIDGDVDNVTIKGIKFFDIDNSVHTSLHKEAILDMDSASSSETLIELANIKIESNYFKNVPLNAIALGTHGDTEPTLNGIIKDNKIENVGKNGEVASQSAIQVFDSTGVEVTNNIIDGATHGGINFSSMKDGLIADNVIKNIQTAGINIADSPDSNSIIRDNTVTNANLGDTDDYAGISLYPSSDGFTITGNTMKNNHNGFSIRDKTSESPPLDDYTLRLNKFIDNDGLQIGIFSNNGAGAEKIDAAKNWFGDKTGPKNSTANTSGKGGVVSDNVSFIPYSLNAGNGLFSNEISDDPEEKTKLKPSSDKVTFDDGDDTNEVKGQAALPEDVVEIELQNDAVLDVNTNVGEKTGDNIEVSGASVDLKTFAVKKKDSSTEAKDLTQKQKVASVEVQIEKAVKMKSGTASEPIKIKNAALTTVEVSIPDETTILAPSGWSGTIQPPKSASNSGTAPSGFSVGNNAIEVGSPDAVLLFDSPVTLTLEGVTGAVGYKPAGSTTWLQITETCGGTYASPNEPSAFPGECFISDGTNTKIVTYHFTSFGGLSAASSSSSSGGGGSSDDDTKPVLQSNSLSSSDSNIYAGTLKLDDSARNSASIFETGDTIDMELSFYENSGPQSLEHVTLFTDISGFEDRYDSNLYVEWNKDKPLKIFDSEGYLDDSTDVSFVERDNNLVMVFHLNFVKPMDVSHIVLNFWDYKRNSGLVTFDDAISVVKPADEVISEIPDEDSVTSNLEENSVEIPQKAPLAIPAWIKNNAGWWADGQIEDGTFTNGIQYLIDEKIINVPSQPNISKDPAVVEEPQKIPEWVRNSASWWADDLISENEFVNSIQWLVTNGILKI